jgi:hypothetical protein
MTTTEHIHNVVVTSDVQNTPTPVLTTEIVQGFASALSTAGAPTGTLVEVVLNSLGQPQQLRATWAEA